MLLPDPRGPLAKQVPSTKLLPLMSKWNPSWNPRTSKQGNPRKRLVRKVYPTEAGGDRKATIRAQHGCHHSARTDIWSGNYEWAWLTAIMIDPWKLSASKIKHYVVEGSALLPLATPSVPSWLTYAHIHILRHAQVHACTHTYTTHKHIHTHTSTNIRTHTYIHTCIHTSILTHNTHTHLHKHIHIIHACTCLYTHRSTSTQGEDIPVYYKCQFYM